MNGRRRYRLHTPYGRGSAFASREAAVKGARRHATRDPLRAIVGGWGVYTVALVQGSREHPVSVVSFDADGRMVERHDYDPTRTAL